MSEKGEYQGQTWWVVTDYEGSPCCNAPNIATNGEKAICQCCGWKGDHDEVVA